MSAALIRQALEFVDPDENSGSSKKRVGARPQSSSGQGSKSQAQLNKISKQKRPQKEVSEEVINKLLILSAPAVNTATAGKIIERAVTRKPVIDKIKLNTTDQQQSILFPEEDFKQSEGELFCSLRQ